MHMTEADICKEYREAKDKRNQIKVLAELNLCGEDEIAALLTRCGEEVPDGKPKPERKARRKNWDKALARKLHGEGAPDRAIGEAVGVSLSTVYAWRTSEGLPRNDGRRKPEPVPKPHREPPPIPVKPAIEEAPDMLEIGGPVSLSVEWNGLALSLRAPDLEGAAWVCGYAGKVLADMGSAVKKGE